MPVTNRANPVLRSLALDAVAIEVIGREVQQHRDPRMERVGALELKAARLDDVNGVVGRLLDAGRTLLSADLLRRAASRALRTADVHGAAGVGPGHPYGRYSVAE